MKFEEIVGNEDVKRALKNMVDEGRVPHSILFHENDGGGALVFIQAFLQYLNCKNRNNGEACGKCPSCNQISKYIHPDIHYTFPITSGTKVSGKVSDLISNDYISYWRDLAINNPYFMESQLTVAMGIDKKSGLISTAESKYILGQLSLSTISEGYRVIVIWLPEKMNQAAANSLLKELEEPNEKTIFLMVTHNPEQVMQTISSRCLRIRLLPNTPEQIVSVVENQFREFSDKIKAIAGFVGGSVGQAIYTLSDSKFSSQMENIFADLMEKLISRDLGQVLTIGEDLAGLDSREKQKAFCIFAGECIRKIFMYQQDLKEISGVCPEEDEFYKTLALKCKKSFCKKAMIYLDRASMLLGRNVNQKIIFCNLVNKMFVSV